MSVVVKNLNYIYNPNTPFSRQALKNVNLEIETGEFVCIIGHTGSGKSTFIQHLNGLIKLQSGSIVVDDIDLSVKKPDYKALRAKVGMVFQYPEYQLFADTVYKDIAFGPTNMKLSEKDIDSRVIEAMQLVGLNPSVFKDKSPFELSGGEKRRAAIAGVIAMRPSVLVLDEPTAGLDPKGKHEILNLITDLKQKSCPTIIMVNHDMNEVCEYATKVAVMHNGTVMRYDTPQNIFSDTAFLKEMELELPSMAIIREKLLSHGIEIDRDCLTVDKMYKELKALYDRRSN